MDKGFGLVLGARYGSRNMFLWIICPVVNTKGHRKMGDGSSTKFNYMTSDAKLKIYDLVLRRVALLHCSF